MKLLKLTINEANPLKEKKMFHTFVAIYSPESHGV